MKKQSGKPKLRWRDRWRRMPVPRRIAILLLASFVIIPVFGRYFTNISRSIQRDRDPYYRQAEEFLPLFNEQIAHTGMALVYDKNTQWEHTGEYSRSVTLPVSGASVPAVCILRTEVPHMDIQEIEFVQTLPAGASVGSEMYELSQGVLHIFSESDLEWAAQQKERGNPQNMGYYNTFQELQETLLASSSIDATKEHSWRISGGSLSASGTRITVTSERLQGDVMGLHLQFCLSV